MACEHKNLICTNNVFFCRDCGVMVAAPVSFEESAAEEEKPSEAPKKAAKRKAKKEAE